MFFFASQLIHPDMRFDPNSNPPSFASDEQVYKAVQPFWSLLIDVWFKIIEKNTRVRLKIVGTRVDATEIVRFSIKVRKGTTDLRSNSLLLGQ